MVNIDNKLKDFNSIRIERLNNIGNYNLPEDKKLVCFYLISI